jgi:hypothetical protein
MSSLSSLSDGKNLHCYKFYIIHGSDFHRIVAMMIGVTKEEYGIELCLQEEPLLSFLNEMKPKKIVLREELLRRAKLQRTTILPRPAQWERDKILSALRNEFPPKLSTEDVQFLTVQVNALHDLYMKKKKETLSSSSDKNDGQIQGWTSELSHLRFYHSIVMESQRVLQARATTAMAESLSSDVWQSMQFWRDVQHRMNDKLWIPESVSIPVSRFEKRLELQFVFQKPVSLSVLRSKFEKLRQKMKRIHCCQPDGNHELTVQSQKTIPPRISYFLTLLREFGIDLEDSDDFPLPKVPEISLPEEKEDQQKKNIAKPSGEITFNSPQPLPIAYPSHFEIEVDNRNMALASVAIENEETNDIMTVPSESMSDWETTDYNIFLSSFTLYTKQLKMLHSLENDLISLELKRISLTTKTIEGESNPRIMLTTMLDTFCHQKEESIISLKRQMSNLKDITERYAKRCRINNA